MPPSSFYPRPHRHRRHLRLTVPPPSRWRPSRFLVPALVLCFSLTTTDSTKPPTDQYAKTLPRRDAARRVKPERNTVVWGRRFPLTNGHRVSSVRTRLTNFRFSTLSSSDRSFSSFLPLSASRLFSLFLSFSFPERVARPPSSYLDLVYLCLVGNQNLRNVDLSLGEI